MRNLLVLAAFGVVSAAFSAEMLVPQKGTNAFCRVTKLGEHNITGGRCYFLDEVMTGINSLEPLVIRCARLQVDCTRSTEQPTEGNESKSLVE